MLRINTTRRLAHRMMAGAALLFAATVILTGCGAPRPWVAQPQRNWQALPAPAHEDSFPVRMIYLMGDAGKTFIETPSRALQAAEASLATPHCTSLVYIFLGDNIYDHGLTHPGSETHDHERGQLEGQIQFGQSAGQYVTDRIFIPGNHDWGNTDTAGWRRVTRQEAEVEAQNEAQPVADSAAFRFMPSNACPWPEAIDVGPWRIVALNFDYWLYPHAADRPASENPCPNIPWATVRDSLARTLAAARAAGQQLLVINHHPTISNGGHGGRYTWTDHIFPMRVAKKWLWVPLPIIGSLYPILRKNSKNFTDITHPQYAQMAQDLEAVLAQHPGLVYACGHEHILQYNARGGNGHAAWHHILTGAASKHSNARRGLGAQFVYGGQGFARLLEYPGGHVWLEYLRPNRRNPTDEPEVIYRVPLR